MVIDIFTYNGEREILRLHLSALDPFVDKFIIVEANQTFTGHPKPLYFFRDQRYFKPWWPKIENYIVNNWEDEAIWAQARSSPNTQGAFHWQREFYIKESIHKALKHCADDDLIFLGDVDEIWQADPEGEELTYPAKLKLDVYAYYLNNRSNEEFWGTLVAPYSMLKGQCLNHMRSNPVFRSEKVHGWHFTSMGGLKEVQRKLNDSYTTETYNTDSVQQALPERHKQGVDYLGRPFTFIKDESNWPQFLKDHRKDYRHLCIPESPTLN